MRDAEEAARTVLRAVQLAQPNNDPATTAATVILTLTALAEHYTERREDDTVAAWLCPSAREIALIADEAQAIEDARTIETRQTKGQAP